MRNVDLSVLPRQGKSKTRIDWFESIGSKVPFVFDGVVGEFEIKDTWHVNDIGVPKVLVEFNGRECEFMTSSLQRSSIKKLVHNYQGQCEYKAGQVVKDSVRHIKLIKLVKKDYGYKKEYGFDYECLKCGYKGYKTLQSLRNGRGCAYRNSPTCK